MLSWYLLWIESDRENRRPVTVEERRSVLIERVLRPMDMGYWNPETLMAEDRGIDGPELCGFVTLDVLVDEALQILDAQIRYQRVHVEKSIDRGLICAPRNRELLVLFLVRCVQLALDALQFRQKVCVLKILGQRSDHGRLCIEVVDNGRVRPSEIVTKWLTWTPCEEILKEKGALNLTVTDDRMNRLQLILEDTSHSVTSPADSQDKIKQAVRILIVEDYKDLAQQLEMLLGGHGYKVDLVDNGYDALCRLREQTHDIILLDLKMPIVDGGLLIRTLTVELPSVIRRLIVMSGYVEEYKALLVEQGIPFLRKPFLPEELFKTIAQKLTLLGLSPGTAPGPQSASE